MIVKLNLVSCFDCLLLLLPPLKDLKKKTKFGGSRMKANISLLCRHISVKITQMVQRNQRQLCPGGGLSSCQKPID